MTAKSETGHSEVAEWRDQLNPTQSGQYCALEKSNIHCHSVKLSGGLAGQRARLFPFPSDLLLPPSAYGSTRLLAPQPSKANHDCQKLVQAESHTSAFNLTCPVILGH